MHGHFTLSLHLTIIKVFRQDLDIVKNHERNRNRFKIICLPKGLTLLLGCLSFESILVSLLITGFNCAQPLSETRITDTCLTSMQERTESFGEATYTEPSTEVDLLGTD